MSHTHSTRPNLVHLFERDGSVQRRNHFSELSLVPTSVFFRQERTAGAKMAQNSCAQFIEQVLR